jgi:catalase
VRSETFADHYSQARLFFESQTEPEQEHIAAALTFELSKVKTPVIRERMVSHLVNIHENLAALVVKGLGLKSLPRAAEAAMPTRKDLPASPTLSIIKNGPGRFEGRKLGIVLTERADATKFNALKAAVKEQGGVSEVVTPEIGGINLSDGTAIAGDQMLKGGPSVLYDAVALLFGEESGEVLMEKPEARDFVADAFAHCKFIGFGPEALPLLDKAGIASTIDEGMIELSNTENILKFVSLLGQLRLWKRETLFFG